MSSSESDRKRVILDARTTVKAHGLRTHEGINTPRRQRKFFLTAHDWSFVGSDLWSLREAHVLMSLRFCLLCVADVHSSSTYVRLPAVPAPATASNLVHIPTLYQILNRCHFFTHCYTTIRYSMSNYSQLETCLSPSSATEVSWAVTRSSSEKVHREAQHNLYIWVASDIFLVAYDRVSWSRAALL